MSNNKQSSIEWLVRKLSTELIGEIPIHRWDEIRDTVQQAKAMHKQEILDAYLYGSQDAGLIKRHQEQYYNETFKQD